MNKPTINTKDTPITATELYALDAKPKFLSQTPIQDDGSIIMKWDTREGIYYTKSRPW